jgi:hypothetical protein
VQKKTKFNKIRSRLLLLRMKENSRLLLRRYVAAGAATYNNQNKTKTNETNKRSRKWQTPFVHTNGTAAARTLPTTQKRKTGGWMD